MNKTIILIISIFCIFSSCKNSDDKSECSLFIRNTPQFPYKHGVISILFENKKVYFNESIPVAGENKLYYRELSTIEQDTLKNIIGRALLIDEKDYLNNVYGATFEYSIYMRDDNKEKQLKIFADSIPISLEALIAFFNSFVENRNYSELSSKLEGVDDGEIIAIENVSDISSRLLSFRLKKYLICYNDIIDTISVSEKRNSHNVYYEFIYGLGYKGKRIKIAEINKNSINLIYDTGLILRINKADFNDE